MVRRDDGRLRRTATVAFAPLVCLLGCDTSSDANAPSDAQVAQDAGIDSAGLDASGGFPDATLDVPSAGCVTQSECPQGQTCAASGACVATEDLCPDACGQGMFCSGGGGCIAEGACNVNPDCAVGFVCDPAASACVPGGGCGSDEFAIDLVQPNVMLVVDRTGSMGDADVPGTGGMTRWEVATQAIESLTAAYGERIRFGLVLFSACAPGGCSPGTIVLPIPSTPTQINDTIASTILCPGNDPETIIAGTLDGLVGEPTLQDPTRDNAVLLLTDGDDNCGGGGPAAAQALMSQAIPVPTFVVGFSGDVDADELTAIAEAAGTAPYYQADDPVSLEAALKGVAAEVASCTFTLQDTPPDDQMYVFFNNDPAGIPESATDGYTYDPATNTLTFHGSACDAVQAGTVTDIDVVFGCPVPTPR